MNVIPRPVIKLNLQSIIFIDILIHIRQDDGKTSFVFVTVDARQRRCMDCAEGIPIYKYCVSVLIRSFINA